MEKKRVIFDIIGAAVILVAAFFVFILVKSTNSSQTAQSVDTTAVLEDYITSTIQPVYIQPPDDVRQVTNKADASKSAIFITWSFANGSEVSFAEYNKEEVLMLKSMLFFNQPAELKGKTVIDLLKDGTATVLLKKYFNGNYVPKCSIRANSSLVCEDFKKGDGVETGAGVAYYSNNAYITRFVIFSCEIFEGGELWGTGSCWD